MSRPTAYLPIHVQTIKHRNRKRCQFCGNIYRTIRVDYTCAEGAWKITRLPKRTEKEWLWQAEHQVYRTQVWTTKQSHMSMIFGQLQIGELLYRCLGCQGGMRYCRRLTGPLLSDCRCPMKFGFLSNPQVWQSAMIARCIHCSMPLVFHEKTFSWDVRRHNKQVHRGHLYGDQAQYDGNQCLRRAFWDQHFIFEQPS
jgi:hypothetical protein